MRKMNQTSILTYEENKDTFKSDKETILFYLQHYFKNGATQEDFEQILKKPVHTFSGRFTELVDENRIYKHGDRLTVKKNGKSRRLGIYHAN